MTSLKGCWCSILQNNSENRKLEIRLVLMFNFPGCLQAGCQAVQGVQGEHRDDLQRLALCCQWLWTDSRGLPTLHIYIYVYAYWRHGQPIWVIFQKDMSQVHKTVAAAVLEEIAKPLKVFGEIQHKARKATEALVKIISLLPQVSFKHELLYQASLISPSI